MRDVVPPNDRSIRNIPVPAHRKRPVPGDTAPVHVPTTDSSDDGVMADVVQKRRPRRSAMALWIGAAGIIGVLLAVLLSYFFAGATVTVTPKMEHVAAGTSVPAKLDAPLGTLPYQTVTQSVTGSRTVPTSGEAAVSRRASGTIIISNTYNTSLQRLIKNTRFEAENGKIYRIDNSVDVPGAKKNADGSLSAGTVSVQVFADSPGESYNQGPTTFTIPGFKGDPRYTKFSAKSTTPLADGFVGTEKVVSDADLKAAKESIAGELTGKLTEVLKANVPEGFIYVEGSERFSTEDLPRSAEGAGGALISVRGTGVVAIIKADYAASALLKAVSESYAGEAVYFADQGNVKLAASAPLSADLKNDLSITLTDEASVVWRFDEEGLKSALIGARANDLQSIMQQFKPAIAEATVSLRPVWTSSFPSDASKITLKIEK